MDIKSQIDDMFAPEPEVVEEPPQEVIEEQVEQPRQYERVVLDDNIFGAIGETKVSEPEPLVEEAKPYEPVKIEGIDELFESIDIKKAPMGEVIKDFRKSDAPQFQGKSDKKKQQMAIAAKLATEESLMDTYVSSLTSHTKKENLKVVELTEEERFKNLETQLLQVKQLFHEATMVSGIGQGGDGQTPGSGVVRFFDLDDVVLDDQLEEGQGIIWDGENWVNGNSDVIDNTDLNVAISDPVTMFGGNPGAGDPDGHLPAYDTNLPTTQKDYNFWIHDAMKALNDAVVGNTTNIVDLTTRVQDIEAVSGDLTQLRSDVDQNTLDIAALVAELDGEEDRIDDNEQGVADNAAAIALLEGRMDGAEADILQNASDIASLNLDALTDVDTTTTPPTEGQAILYDATEGKWLPGDVLTDDIPSDAANFTWNDHLVPDTDTAYDLGTADKKVRHLFLSDNSLKFESGDVGVVNNKLQFAGNDLIDAQVFGEHEQANVDAFNALDARLDQLEVSKGSIKEYDIKEISSNPTVRQDEIILNNADHQLVTQLSIGLTDKQGNNSHIIDVGDIIEIDRKAPYNDEVRYVVTAHNPATNLTSVTYANSIGVTDPYAVGETLEIYVYPQNQGDTISEGEVDSKLANYVAKSGSTQTITANFTMDGGDVKIKNSSDKALQFDRNGYQVISKAQNDLIIKMGSANALRFKNSGRMEATRPLVFSANGYKYICGMGGEAVLGNCTTIDGNITAIMGWDVDGVNMKGDKPFNLSSGGIRTDQSRVITGYGGGEQTFYFNDQTDSRLRILINPNSSSYFKIANGTKGCLQVQGDYAITSSTDWNTALINGTNTDATALVTKGYVDANSGNYSLPTATTSTKGGVKAATTSGTYVGCTKMNGDKIGVVESTNTTKGVNYKGQCAVTSGTPSASSYQQGTVVWSTTNGALYVVT